MLKNVFLYSSLQSVVAPAAVGEPRASFLLKVTLNSSRFPDQRPLRGRVNDVRPPSVSTAERARLVACYHKREM